MPNLDKTLAQMAERLGTKAETLWPQIVAAQRVEWITGTLICALTLSGCAYLFYTFMKRLQDNDLDPLAMFGSIISAMVGIVSTVFLFIYVSHISSMLIYPEVGAMNYVLGR